MYYYSDIANVALQQNNIRFTTLIEDLNMFGKYSEQMKKSAQPASSLFEMNKKALELVVQQNTAFFSGLMNDSVKLVKTISAETELNSVLAAQSVYAESLRERLTSASRTTYTELNSIRAEMTDIVKTSLENVSNETKKAFTPAVAKVVKAKPVTKAKTVAKKPATKAAPVTKAKPAKKTQPVAKKPVAKAAPVAKPAPKAKPAAKATTAAKPVAKAKPAAKKPATKKTAAKASPATKAEKVVAKLSPADVKAADKK